jgi:hypothetical protein
MAYFTEMNIHKPYSQLFSESSKFPDPTAQIAGVERTENLEQLVV